MLSNIICWKNRPRGLAMGISRFKWHLGQNTLQSAKNVDRHASYFDSVLFVMTLLVVLYLRALRYYRCKILCMILVSSFGICPSWLAHFLLDDSREITSSQQQARRTTLPSQELHTARLLLSQIGCINGSVCLRDRSVHVPACPPLPESRLGLSDHPQTTPHRLYSCHKAHPLEAL